METYADITPDEPEWIWANRIVAGDITMIVGQGGIGKGFLLCDIISRVTRGEAMPGETEKSQPGSVILVSPEDRPEFTTVQRLTAAECDLSRVVDLSEIERAAGTHSGTTRRMFTIPDDIPELRRVMRAQGDTRLVVIDPLASCVVKTLYSNLLVRREVIGPLQALARDTGVAIVLVHHMVKDGKTIAGSHGLVDAVRVALTVMISPEDESQRLVLSRKNNLATDAQIQPVSYTIAGDWPDTRVRFIPTGAEEQASAKSLEERVYATLASASVLRSPQSLACEFEVKYARIKRALRMLDQAGLVVSPKRHAYAARSTMTEQEASACSARGMVV